MDRKQGFSYWVDGRRTWELGIAGFFTRLRAYFGSSILVGLPLAGTPFWWPAQLPKAIEVNSVALVLATGAIAFLAFTALFFYVRARTERSLEIKSKLHRLLAEINQALQLLYRRHSKIPPNGEHTAVHEGEHLVSATNQIAEVIGQYFSTLTGDQSVGAIICLATASDQDSKQTVYSTFGRSGALNKDRGSSSEPTPRDKGFPRFFLGGHARCRGVLFIEDITKATAKDVYFRTKNDEIYGDDFKTLAVVPITGWNGVEEDLIGFLALTSRNHRILQPRHVDLMRFTGEALGVFYGSFFAKLLAVGSLPPPLTRSVSR